MSNNNANNNGNGGAAAAAAAGVSAAAAVAAAARYVQNSTAAAAKWAAVEMILPWLLTMGLIAKTPYCNLPIHFRCFLGVFDDYIN